MSMFMRFLQDESGATAIEYALIAHLPRDRNRRRLGRLGAEGHVQQRQCGLSLELTRARDCPASAAVSAESSFMTT